MKLSTFRGAQLCPQFQGYSLVSPLRQSLIHSRPPRAERLRAYPVGCPSPLQSAPRGKGLQDPGLGEEGAVPCRPSNYHFGSQRPARRHQEGGRRVTAAARDRPEPAPATTDTYLTRQSSAAETPPLGAPAQARDSNLQAPRPSQRAASTSGCSPLGPKARRIHGRPRKGMPGRLGKPSVSPQPPNPLYSGFLLTP